MAVIKVSILRVDEALLDLRLRSMHSPEKKDSTISAIAEGGIQGFFCLDIQRKQVFQ